MVTSSPLFRCAVVLVACALLLPGCVTSKYGEQQVKVNHYPQCYEPIQKLRDDENAVAKSTATGAVTGAAAGALIGGLATRDWKGAAAGAAAGGAVGAVGGNIYGKQKQKQRDAEFVAKYASMLDEDTADMNRVMAASRVAQACYEKEFRKIVADYKAGRITRKDSDARYEEIRAGMQEVSFILKKKYDDMTARDQEYTKALAEDYTEAKPRKVKTSGKPNIRNSASNRKHTLQQVSMTESRTRTAQSKMDDMYTSIIARDTALEARNIQA